MINNFYNLIPENILNERFQYGPFNALIPGTNRYKNAGFHGVVKVENGKDSGLEYGTEYTMGKGPSINPWNNIPVITNVLVPYQNQAIKNRQDLIDSGKLSGEEAEKNGYFRYGPKSIDWNGKIYSREDIVSLYDEAQKRTNQWAEARIKDGKSPWLEPKYDLIQGTQQYKQVDEIPGYWPGMIPRTYTNESEDDLETSHKKWFDYANDLNTREASGENVDDEYDALKKTIPFTSQLYKQFNRFNKEQMEAEDWSTKHKYPGDKDLNDDSAQEDKKVSNNDKQETENKSFSNFSVDDFKNEWNAIIQEGLLDGRIKLYHGTKLKNKKSILDRGLLGKYALDEGNITNSVNPKWGKLEGRDLVYLSKNTLMPNIIKKSHNRKGEKGTLLEISIPYDEYGKLKITDNPETRGENLKQKQDLAIKLYKKQNGNKKIDKDLEKYLYKILPDLFHNTVVIEGDIKPKFIIGSKKYNKNSFGEAIKYISNHPERFGDGVLRGLKTPKKLFD